VSNLPLFALATPMLAVLAISSIRAMQLNIGPRTGRGMSGLNAVSPIPVQESIHGTRRLLRSFAVPQFLLAVLALTSYHVQIITRISSGYFVWYFWLAALLMETSNFVSTDNSQSPKKLIATELGLFSPTEVIRYMVLYAAVQAGLYSSFLPPA
jgi:GPI mannosyltransferase 2